MGGSARNWTTDIDALAAVARVELHLTLTNFTPEPAMLEWRLLAGS